MALTSDVFDIPSYCVTMAIYRNTFLPGFVKMRRVFLDRHIYLAESDLVPPHPSDVLDLSVCPLPSLCVRNGRTDRQTDKSHAYCMLPSLYRREHNKQTEGRTNDEVENVPPPITYIHT